MQPIIEVHKIGKQFKIHHNKQPYLSLRDNIVQYIKNPLSLFQASDEEFWALKDVSFTVLPGESIGIIGKNGAGKSTLLKILSRITPPSEGRIVLRGRVASLLEVGTGFHPELTGRENVYFNGAILGMQRQEIKKKFDAIVDFAGVEKFIDTPLKHYSSGMQLRLAFAVAAFLEAEILVVDEVLAVGDAEFQKKCLGKMEDVTKNEGRTVLFVSHNMGALRMLCEKSILVEKGNLIEFAETFNVVEKYLGLVKNNSFNGKINFDKSIIKEIQIKCDGKISNILYSGCKFELKVFFESDFYIDFPVLGVLFRDEFNQPLLGINNKYYTSNLVNQKTSKGTIILKIDFFPLYSGNYTLDLYFGEQHRDIEIKKNVLNIKVEPKGLDNGLELPNPNFNKFLIKDVQWEIT